jgi:type IVB pilus formation R64 PilN family outer membrane protein
MMLAKGGNVQVSPSTGYLTVTTTPPSMDRISNYITEINDTAKKKIAIRIDVYDVSESNTSNYGLNWNLLYKVTQGSFSWNSTKIANALSSPFASVQTGQVAASITHGPFSGSEIIGNALQQFGHTSHITGTTVYTVNGRPAPIQVSRSTAYVKQVSVTTLGGDSSSGSNNNVEVSATPGTVNTGYSITVTPKIIQGNEVVVNMSVNIASLLALRQQVFGPKDAQNTIELPDTRNKAFMEAVPLRSGQTAVLAGFQNNVNDTGTNSMGPSDLWALGGNQSTDHENTITVVVVTPYIIGNN